MANFTTSTVNFIENAGANVGILHPTASILITPDTGYTVNYTSFSQVDPLPAEISTLVFTQSGLNVLATATFVNPLIMPAYDLSIPLCINGSADIDMYDISGTIYASTTNTSLPVPLGSTPYNISGDFGETHVVLIYPVNAISGYYFPTVPSLALTTGDSGKYTITSSKVFNTEGQLTNMTFSISYTFPNYDVSGNLFTLTAAAAEIYNPAVEITGYSFALVNVLISGETRGCSIYGIEGAAYNLVYTNSIGTIINTFSGVIGPSGIANLSIYFPASLLESDYYDFVLTGDLSASFNTPSGQSSTWRVLQLVQTALFFDINSTSLYITTDIPRGTYYNPGILSEITQTYTFTITSDIPMIITTPPTPASWTTQGAAIPPDFNYDFTVATTVASLDETEKILTVVASVNVDVAGSTTFTSTLDLDDYIDTVPAGVCKFVEIDSTVNQSRYGLRYWTPGDATYTDSLFNSLLGIDVGDGNVVFGLCSILPLAIWDSVDMVLLSTLEGVSMLPDGGYCSAEDFCIYAT